MKFLFDVLFKTKDYAVEMKPALKTLEGVEDLIHKSAKYVLTEVPPERIPYNEHEGIILDMKKTFEGSYAISFELSILDKGYQEQIRKMTQKTFLQAMEYFICESMYTQTVDNPSKATDKKLESLASRTDDFIEVLRRSPLKNSHASVTNIGIPVEIRRRFASGKTRTVLHLDKKTELALVSKEDPKHEYITAAVTRLNIFTGRGRILIQGEEKTVSFSSKKAIQKVPKRITSLLSDNLSLNDKIKEDALQYLSFKVHRVTDAGGSTIMFKYVDVREDALNHD